MKTKYYLIAILVLMIAIFFSADSKASNYNLIIHVGSSHIDQPFYYDYETGEQAEFNQQNPGIGIGYDITQSIQARAGIYKNSHYKTSTYAALYFNKKFNRYLSAGIQAGAITGYQNTVNQQRYNYPVAPLLLPTAAITFNRASVEVGYIPKLFASGSAVVSLSTSFKF